jgi:hypothetical protein
MEDKGTKAIKLGQMLLNDEDLKIRVQYNGEMFTMRYPTPLEKAQIESDIARTLGGMPRSAFPEEHLFLVEATAYVNRLVVVEECPDWFKSAWTCYDERLTATLYGEYLTFRNSFRNRVAEGGLPGAGTKQPA